MDIHEISDRKDKPLYDVARDFVISVDSIDIEAIIREVNEEIDDHVNEILSAGTIIGYSVSGKLVGFAVYKTDEAKQLISISSFGVLASERGKGHGDKFMALLIPYFKNLVKYNRINIGTQAGNKAALALYKRHGFTEYKRGEDNGWKFVLLKKSI